jgi:carnitine O-acetyltransferase
VAADGYGIGYIIKDDMISVCASSKHLQTRRFLDTLSGYLYDVQRILVQLYMAVNERPAPFIDHYGVLRDSKTGNKINGNSDDEEDDDDETVRTWLTLMTSSTLTDWVDSFWILIL